MDLVTLKRDKAGGDAGEDIAALKPPVDPATLLHGQLRSGPFWQRVPAYANVDEAPAEPTPAPMPLPRPRGRRAPSALVEVVRVTKKT